MVHDKGQGTGPKDEVGRCSTSAALMSAMLGVEACARAQERYGKGKSMTGEQVRWGLENLTLDQKKLDALGFAGVMRPISHLVRRPHGRDLGAGPHLGRHASGTFTSDWLQADDADHQADGQERRRQVRGEKKLTRRTPADCQT